MRSMRSLVQEFNVYRWAGRMLIDAARMRHRSRVMARARRRAGAVRRADVAMPPFHRNWAFFLDIDGTLLELAETPDAVRRRPGRASLLLRGCRPPPAARPR